MLPTINKRFLIKLVIAVVAAVGVLFGTHALQARRIPDALKEQSDRAAESAKDDPAKADAAVRSLRQYLEFRPDDVDALEQLATLLRQRNKTGDPSALLRYYDKILRLDPARHEIRREALKASLRLTRFTDAETHAQALLKQYPDDRELWLDLAFAQRGLQKHADARDSYEAAIKCDPKKQGPYQEYAEYLHNELKKKDDAKAVLDRLIAAVPDEPESYTARGRFHAAAGNDPLAAADARKALELAPQNAEAMLLLGEQLQKRREEVPAAADLFRDGMKAHPTDARFVRNLAWLEVNRGNSGAAVAALEDGMARVSEKDGFDLLVPLADLLLEMRDQPRAKQLIAKLEGRRETDPAKRKAADLQALYLKGRLAMSESKWDDAIRHLTSLRTQTGELIGAECQANLLISLCLQKKGDFEQEEKTLKLLLGRDPNHGAGRVTLAVAYLNAGRFDDAIAEYEAASRLRFASPSTRSTLLKMKAAKLRQTGAGKLQWAELDAQLAAFAASFGQTTSDYALLRAELLVARDATPQAIAVLQAETAKRPTDPRLWSQYAQAGADLAGVSAGLMVLDEAQAVCGDRAELRLARASLYARDPARLRPLDPLAAQIDTWPEADQNAVLFGLVEIYDRLGDEAGVVRTYRRIAGRHPTNVTVWEGLFDRATRGGDTKTADEAQAMLTKLEPVPGESATLLKAWEVANARRAGDAPAAAEALVKRFGATPERAEACVALARLKALAGDAAGAEPLFARAVRLDPVRFGPTQEYLAFLTANGDAAKLARLTTRLAQDHRWNGEPLRRAVRQTVARVEPAAAKRLIESVQGVVERGPDGTGWLGDCLRSAGFKAEAMACYERAVTRPTATSDDWLRLAVRTAEAGDADAAKAVLARAKTKLPSPQHYLMTAAVFADSSVAPKDWQPDTATAAERKTFTQARLAVKLSRFQKDEAISLLEDFLTDKKLPTADAAWARRNLAMLLAARGTGNDKTRAKEMLAGADVSPGETADDRRATAAVLAGLSRQLEGGDRELVLNRAVEVLSAVVEETKLSRDRFLLSQLYRTAANGNTDAKAKESRVKGRVLLQGLIKDDPKNPEFYVAALDEATEPEDQAFAKSCAGFLIANYKHEFRVVQAVARYECRTDHSDQALAHVIAYARTADDTPGDLQARNGRAAELLDELARKPGVRGTDVGHQMTAAAIEKYEGLFVTRPEAMVAIAGLLAHDGHPAEAFAKIEKHAKLLPARVKVLAGLAAVRAGGASDEQLAKVQEWMAAAKTEEPGSVSVLMNEGEFLTLRHDAAGAEKAYQAVLDIDDQNVVALNNLAWILSARPDAAERALDLVERAVRVIGLTGELLDTRARVKIAQKQYEAAERDLLGALKQEQTPLRLFHLAMARNAQAPAKKDEAADSFREAKKRGLQERSVHPDDVDTYREFDKTMGAN